jgi:hypothetical protein
MVDMEAVQMKRKITLSQIEITTIVAALMAYECPNLASIVHARFETEDSANDGPEIFILAPQKNFS